MSIDAEILSELINSEKKVPVVFMNVINKSFFDTKKRSNMQQR